MTRRDWFKLGALVPAALLTKKIPAPELPAPLPEKQIVYVDRPVLLSGAQNLSMEEMALALRLKIFPRGDFRRPRVEEIISLDVDRPKVRRLRS